MDIKQSLKNVLAWAKSHPWLAGAVVLVVVLIGWWVSKNSGGAPGAQLGTGEEAPTDLSLGDLGDASGSGLLESIGALGGGGGSIPSIPSFDMGALPSLMDVTDLGFGNASAFYDAPTVSGNMETAAKSGLIMSSIFAQGADPYEAKPMPTIETVAPAQNLITSSLAATGASASASKPVANPTPSMLVGKGRHFTGTFQGITYFDGYPVGTGGGSVNVGLPVNVGIIASVADPYAAKPT